MKRVKCDDNDITTKNMQERIENLFAFVKNEKKFIENENTRKIMIGKILIMEQ